MLDPVTLTRLEKAATDNGFDLDRGRAANWLHFGSSQTAMQIWLTAVGESLFVVATRDAANCAGTYSAQQESFAGSLNREMATIFSASDSVGYTCSNSAKSWILARKRSAIAASWMTSAAP